MLCLTLGHRERAVGMTEMGATHAFIARTFDCSRLAVTNLMQRYRHPEQASDRPRTGRPTVTTPHEDRYLHVLHLQNHFLVVTPSETNYWGHRVSRQTVAGRLWTHGIRAYIPYRGHLLTSSELEMGPDCTALEALWLAEGGFRWWKPVLFGLFTHERRRVYCRSGERTALSYVQEIVPFGGGQWEIQTFHLGVGWGAWNETECQGKRQEFWRAKINIY